MTPTRTPFRPTAAPSRTPVPVWAALRRGLDTTARVSPALAGRAALELWRRPGRPAPVHPSERAVHEAARLTLVEHDGSQVATYSWGDGRRSVLLVHGWAARASRFATLVEALLRVGLSPIAYDAWGHGATPGPVRTILDHRSLIEDLARRHGGFSAVIGHSLGVPIAWYAAGAGLEVRRVVAINGVGDFGFAVDGFCARIGVRDPVRRALRRSVERTYFDGDGSIWERFSAGRLPGVEVLVVHDTQDAVVPRAQADLLLAAQGDRARLIETTSLGHSGILRDPQLAGEVAGFLGEGPA